MVRPPNDALRLWLNLVPFCGGRRMLSIVSWPKALGPKGVVGNVESASRNGGTPVSSGPEACPGVTALMPTMMMGTMRPSDEPSAECLPDVVRAAAVPDEPNLNIRKKLRGVWPGPVLAPLSSDVCPPCLNADASLPLSRDCRKLSNVPSSPSPAVP